MEENRLGVAVLFGMFLVLSNATTVGLMQRFGMKKSNFSML